MDMPAPARLNKVAGILESFTKVVLLPLVLVLLALYIFAIPLGFELFFSGKLSTTYNANSPISLTFLFVRAEVSLGFAFASLLVIYISCFALAWGRRNSFHKVISGLLLGKLSSLLSSFLFAMPVLTSLTYVVVVSIHSFEESYGIPVGEPPVPPDPLLAFFELAISPLTEEIIFRVFPIGVFSLAYLLVMQKKRMSPIAWKERLKFAFLVVINPQDAKKKLALRNVDDCGFWGGISLDEWGMILFTSAFFGFSHYFFTSTWNVGKIASSFIQGLVMGLSYLMYGIQAPILIHWFFNYYFYAYSLAAIVHPILAPLNSVNENLTWILGIVGLLIMMTLVVKGATKTSTSISSRPVYLAQKIKKKLAERGEGSSVSLLRFGFGSFRRLTFDLATLLLLIFAIFAVRLAIVYLPSPEAGGRYYETGFVFDESYYVKAARKLLAGEPANNEHPPLSKVLIMLGISLFGDNPLGWRIFSIISSSLSIALLYKLALLLTKRKTASFSAALLFATDVMVFNTGQIAMLDAPAMTFTLAASVLFLQERYDLSGLFFGLSFLSKLSSAFVAAGTLIFFLLMKLVEGRKFPVRRLRAGVTPVGRIFFIAFVTFLIGLWIYDAGYRVFNRNPLEHLNFMFNYYSSLRYDNPDDVILPLQWVSPLNRFSPVPYHVISVREISGSGILREYHPIAYYGVYTPLWWSIWIVTALSLAETVRKAGDPEHQGAGLFVLSWIAASFLPNVVFAYLMKRWVYPFYFYTTLPGIYLGLCYYLTHPKVSRTLLPFSVGIQLFWFLLWFPVKPKILIDFLSLLGFSV